MLLRNTFLSLAFAVVVFGANPVVDQARKNIAARNYDAAITPLEAAYKAKPDADVKKALADANLGKGDSFMYNDALAPRMKYPSALRAYREVLKYDKENQKAQQGIATIEGIYKQMGRPVPQ